MPSAFNFAASPFDCLSAAEQEQVRRNVDIAYFREGDMVLERRAALTTCSLSSGLRRAP